MPEDKKNFIDEEGNIHQFDGTKWLIIESLPGGAIVVTEDREQNARR